MLRPRRDDIQRKLLCSGFNGHPPLGVNATLPALLIDAALSAFQRAPTLGGECYFALYTIAVRIHEFQRAPTLGGECYRPPSAPCRPRWRGFNGHPPLGVNATNGDQARIYAAVVPFQRAPTLGGECYATMRVRGEVQSHGFQRAPTLGGECYHSRGEMLSPCCVLVSTGTHPWG